MIIIIAAFANDRLLVMLIKKSFEKIFVHIIFYFSLNFFIFHCPQKWFCLYTLKLYSMTDLGIEWIFCLFHFIYELHIFFYISVPSGRISCVQCTPSDYGCDTGNIAGTPCGVEDNYCGIYRVVVGNSK